MLVLTPAGDGAAPCSVQILLGPQTFSSIAARLAELGVRLMLTETEAEAAAAAAGGGGGSAGAGIHHTAHHTHGSGHGAASKSFAGGLQKTASSAAAFLAAGRGSRLSALTHEPESLTQGECGSGTLSLSQSLSQPPGL